MKEFFIEHKNTICVISILIALCISIFSISFGTEDYEKTDFEYAKVTASTLNVRRGPGISYQAVGLLKKDDYIRVFAKIGNWYVIQTEKNIIGTVYCDYVEPCSEDTTSPFKVSSETSSVVTSSTQTDETVALDTPLINYTEDEQEFINLINTERKKNNLPELEIDEELQNTARLKAEDLVKNNYFSHTSPTYGDLYKMLDSCGIKYKTANENIAGNSSVSGAFEALMASETHKNNILSNIFNYTGVGVVNSPIYGKILVELFIGK